MEAALVSALAALSRDPTARESLLEVLLALSPDSSLVGAEACRTRQRLLQEAVRRRCSVRLPPAASLRFQARLAETLGLRRLRSLLLGRAAWLAASPGGTGARDALSLLLHLLPRAEAVEGAEAHPLARWRALQQALLWEALTCATRCADAAATWAAAARLLTHHSRQLGALQQQALLRALQAASGLLPPGAPPPGAPPPCASLLRLCPLPVERLPQARAAPPSPPPSPSPRLFLFSPFERARAARAEAAAAAAAAAQPLWVSSESCEVLVLLRNPCCVALRLQSLALQALQADEPAGSGPAILAQPAGPITLPPLASAEVLLRCVPLREGRLMLAGLRCEAFGAAWSLPFAPLPLCAATVLPPMPLLQAQLWLDAEPGGSAGGGGGGGGGGGPPPSDSPRAPSSARATPPSSDRPARLRRSRSSAVFSAAGEEESGGGGGGGGLQLTLWEGEAAQIRLSLRNMGPVRALEAALDVERLDAPRDGDGDGGGDGDGADGATPGGLETLGHEMAHCLPLASGSRLTLPLRLVAGSLGGGEAARTERFELRLRYAAGDAEEGPTGERGAERTLRVPLLLRTGPGLRARGCALRAAAAAAAEAGRPPALPPVLVLALHNAAPAALRVAGALRGGWRAGAEGCEAVAGGAACLAPPGASFSLLFPLPPHAADDWRRLAAELHVSWRAAEAPAGGGGGGLSPLLLRALLAAQPPAAAPPRAPRLLLRLSCEAAPPATAAPCTLPLGRLVRVLVATAPAEGGEAARCAARISVFDAAGARCCPPAAAAAGDEAAPRPLLWAGELEGSCSREEPLEVQLLFVQPGSYTLRCAAEGGEATVVHVEAG